MFRKIKLSILFIIIIILVSCTNNETFGFDYDSSEYVDLFNYKKIEIDQNYTEISSEDIETIINLDLSSNGVYKEIENRDIIESEDIVLIDAKSSDLNTNYDKYYYQIGSGEISDQFDSFLVGKKVNEQYSFILQQGDFQNEISIYIYGIFSFPAIDDDKIICNFYGYSNMDEVEEFIKSRACEEIVFNYAWEIIINNSKIKKTPNSIIEKINMNIDAAYEDAKETGKTIEDYLNDINLTLDDLRNNIENFYYEIMIGKAILDAENISINQVSIDKTIENIASKTKIDKDEIYQYYSSDDLYYQTIMREIKPIIVSNIAIK